jgi:hypothetical protein
MGKILGIGKRKFGKDWKGRLVVRQISINGDELLGGNLRLEGKGEDRENKREVSVMGFKNGE